jgi:general secretion pathway protein D
MMYKHLRAFVIALTLCALLAPSSDAKTRKADKLFELGKAAEFKGDWDKALEYYTQADEASPNDAAYMIAMRRARFQSGQKHVEKGQELRRQGKLQEALQEFQRAIIIDPASAIAQQEMRRTQEILQHPSTNPGDTGLTAAEQVRKEEDVRVASILGPPELKPVIRQLPPTLKMNNQPPRVLFETVGKLAGVNVVFDPQYTPPSRGFSVDLGATSVEQAFDYLAVLTHTFWKPISSTSIFVTEDNVTKRRDYEDEVVKVFYVTNATSVQEFQEIATAIRTVAEIRRVFTYNAQKAMVVRGTVDQVALAEKLIHDLDKPKAEVVVDIIVMETNSARTKDLAATIASAGTAGLNVPIAFSPQNVTTTPANGTTPAATSGVFTLGQVGHLSINDFSTTLPGALLEAMLSDNRTKVLNSPQVRASDGQKVSLKIGDRIPYATGSFQPGVGTVGVSPLVSTQFSFAEVGVNVDITPQVHSNREVSMHVEIEVSSVKQYLTIGGSGGLSQPVIGQRKNTADIRLREGEINILGGLSSSQDSSTVNGIPGLVNIPVLGSALFGSNHTEKDRQELLIVLIPHIVRTPDYSPENLRGIYAGTDQTVKLTYAAKPDEPAAPAAPTAAPAAPGGAAPTGPAPTGLAPGTPPPAKPEAPAGGPLRTASQQSARIQFFPPAVQATVSAPFTVTVQLDGVTDLSSVGPLRVKYDPALLRLNEINPGDLLSRDGQRVTSVRDIRNDTGEATITISRLPDASGVSGAGAAATLNFVAVGKGTGTISVTEAGLKDTKAAVQPVGLASVPVAIQ